MRSYTKHIVQTVWIQLNMDTIDANPHQFASRETTRRSQFVNVFARMHDCDCYLRPFYWTQ